MGGITFSYVAAQISLATCKRAAARRGRAPQKHADCSSTDHGAGSDDSGHVLAESVHHRRLETPITLWASRVIACRSRTSIWRRRRVNAQTVRFMMSPLYSSSFADSAHPQDVMNWFTLKPESWDAADLTSPHVGQRRGRMPSRRLAAKGPELLRPFNYPRREASTPPTYPSRLRP